MCVCVKLGLRWGCLWLVSTYTFSVCVWEQGEQRGGGGGGSHRVRLHCAVICAVLCWVLERLEFWLGWGEMDFGFGMEWNGKLETAL